MIEGSLGWLTIPERMVAVAPDLGRLADGLRSEADRVLVLGSGNAAFSARAVAELFPPAEGFPALSVLDTTVPSAVAAAAEAHDPARTLFVVASRTGSTLEANLLFDFFFDRASKALGGAAGSRFLAVTEAGSALDTEATRRRVRAVVPAEPRAPGAFGGLSQFALVPAALVGADVEEIAARAARMAEACRTPGAENPGLLLGAALGAEALAGRDKLTLSLASAIAAFGPWLEALVSFATAKEGRGIVPVVGEPLGPPAVYGSDRFFVRADAGDAEDPEAGHLLASLVEHGHPLAGFLWRDALDLGAEMFRWQFAAAVAARLLGVNPFDEPDARDARDRANRVLAGAAPEAEAGGAASLGELLSTTSPRGYLAIAAFVAEAPAAAAALEGLRVAVRRTRRIATTAGFGPAVEQALGQLHQGGPDGAFLLLTGPPGAPVAIPNRPWDFGRVLEAQADGVFEALQARGRRVARVRLAGDPAEGIAALAAAVGPEVAA